MSSEKEKAKIIALDIRSLRVLMNTCGHNDNRSQHQKAGEQEEKASVLRYMAIKTRENAGLNYSMIPKTLKKICQGNISWHLTKEAGI
jgi:hypothetical protein